MELSEILNIVVAICTVLLTILAAIGLYTWKHQNRFEEKQRILSDIHKTSRKLCDRLVESLVHIPGIKRDVELTAGSDIALKGEGLNETLSRHLHGPSENDALIKCIEQNGIKWAEKIIADVKSVADVKGDLQILKLNAKVIGFEHLKEFEEALDKFYGIIEMLLKINSLMVLNRSEFETPEAKELIEHFKGLDHMKIGHEIGTYRNQCRDFVQKNLEILYG